MDVQGAFLGKVILHQDLRRAVNERIAEEHFTDDKYRRVYGYLLKHWREFSTSPDVSVMAVAFPSMVWEDHPQPLDYLIDELKRRRKNSILTAGLNDSALLLKSEDNPDATDEVEKRLAEALLSARLETNRTSDIDFTSEEYFNEVQDLLDERMEDPGYLRGISTGFKGIDYVTGGLQPEHFVVLMGIPKSYKSATVLAMAVRIHQQAKRPLFVGFEMSNVEQTDRTLSLISGVSLTRIMNGTFQTMKERLKVNAAHRGMLGMRSFLFSSDITSGMTVSGIQAKIQELDPDVVIIDGAYMMQSEDSRFEPGSAQAITSVSRGLKRLAQSTKLPIVVTTQASQTRSKGGLHMGSAMYSQSWAQDADILLGVERVVAPVGGNDEENEVTTAGPVQVKLRVIESRSGPRKTTVLEWDWSEGLVEELDPQEQMKALNSRALRYEDDDD